MTTVDAASRQTAVEILGEPPAVEPPRLRVGSHLVDVYTNDARFGEVVGHRFADLATGDTASGPGDEVVSMVVRRRDEGWVDWGIWRDGEPMETALAEYYVLFHLQWELNYLVLNGGADTVHAAAVEIGGRAVVLPGSSGSGKTTLAGFLAHHGAGFVADEAVALDPERDEVRTFPRPLGLTRDGPLQGLVLDPENLQSPYEGEDLLVPARSIGAQVTPTRSVPLGAIVFPRYDPSGPDAALQPLPPSVTFERLCASSPSIQGGADAAESFRRLADVARRVPAAEMTSSDLDAARERLLEWCAGALR
jgi:hypothetical protein